MQPGPIPTLGELQRTTPWVWLWCERCQRTKPARLWIVGGLSGAIQTGLLVRLSYQRRLISRDGFGKLCGQFLHRLAAFSWQARLLQPMMVSENTRPAAAFAYAQMSVD